MPQIFAWIAAIQQGRLQNRMPGKITLNSRRINFTACLSLQILIAADVIRIGMRIIDSFQRPFMFIQKLSDLPARVLVIPAVNQADFRIVQLYQSDFCRALYVIIMFRNLYQFIHGICSSELFTRTAQIMSPLSAPFL